MDTEGSGWIKPLVPACICLVLVGGGHMTEDVGSSDTRPNIFNIIDIYYTILLYNIVFITPQVCKKKKASESRCLERTYSKYILAKATRTSYILYVVTFYSEGSARKACCAVLY